MCQSVSERVGSETRGCLREKGYINVLTAKHIGHRLMRSQNPFLQPYGERDEEAVSLCHGPPVVIVPGITSLRIIWV